MSEQFWIGVVSREHVERGVAVGFVQPATARRLRCGGCAPGDRLAMYSPRAVVPDGAPLQAFTATGLVVGDEGCQVEMTPDFKPYRIDVASRPTRGPRRSAR